MKLLQGKTVVVTGGSQGIGLGLVLRVAADGANVVFCSRSADKGAAALRQLEESGGSGHYLQADVGIKDQARGLIEAAVERYGQLDGLVNNAQSMGPWQPVVDKSDEVYELALNSGLHATRWLMNFALPHFRRRGGGRIINFGSRRGVYGARLTAEYNTAKEAIRGLTRTVAREWGCHNVTANVICPASESDKQAEYFKANPELAQRILSTIPLRRMGKPQEDMGALVVGLLSDDARFITGQTFFADGGMHLKRPE